MEVIINIMSREYMGDRCNRSNKQAHPAREDSGETGLGSHPSHSVSEKAGKSVLTFLLEVSSV